MYKSTYIVKSMDCPSEKSIIEMKFAEIKKTIKNMDFDFKNRILIIYHTEKNDKITNLLNELNLGSHLEESKIVEDKVFVDTDKEQKKLLLTVLMINLLGFIIELSFGLFSNSMGLIADSLDMLSDASIYFISLFAIGGTILLKKKIAKVAGMLQIFLSLIGIMEVIRRFLSPEQIVDYRFMIIISIFSFIGNYYGLYLFSKQNSCDAHMRASQICTSNDLIVNVGVIFSGILVYLLDSSVPDLLIGIIVFVVVLNGAFKMLKLSK